MELSAIDINSTVGLDSSVIASALPTLVDLFEQAQALQAGTGIGITTDELREASSVAGMKRATTAGPGEASQRVQRAASPRTSRSPSPRNRLHRVVMASPVNAPEAIPINVCAKLTVLLLAPPLSPLRAPLLLHTLLLLLLLLNRAVPVLLGDPSALPATATAPAPASPISPPAAALPPAAPVQVSEGNNNAVPQLPLSDEVAQVQVPVQVPVQVEAQVEEVQQMDQEVEQLQVVEVEQVQRLLAVLLQYCTNNACNCAALTLHITHTANTNISARHTAHHTATTLHYTAQQQQRRRQCARGPICVRCTSTAAMVGCMGTSNSRAVPGHTGAGPTTTTWPTSTKLSQPLISSNSNGSTSGGNSSTQQRNMLPFALLFLSLHTITPSHTTSHHTTLLNSSDNNNYETATHKSVQRPPERPIFDNHEPLQQHNSGHQRDTPSDSPQDPRPPDQARCKLTLLWPRQRARGQPRGGVQLAVVAAAAAALSSSSAPQAVINSH
eukprot:14216-Heterococcus_DN1.PRE.2